MNFDELNKFILRLTIIKLTLNVFSIVLIFVNFTLAFLLSLSCHAVATIVFGSAYISWFKGIFSEPNKSFEQFKSNIYLFNFLKVLFIVLHVFVYGLAEVYTYTQAARIKSIKSEGKL